MRDFTDQKRPMGLVCNACLDASWQPTCPGSDALPEAFLQVLFERGITR